MFSMYLKLCPITSSCTSGSSPFRTGKVSIPVLALITAAYRTHTVSLSDFKNTRLNPLITSKCTATDLIKRKT